MVAPIPLSSKFQLQPSGNPRFSFYQKTKSGSSNNARRILVLLSMAIVFLWSIFRGYTQSKGMVWMRLQQGMEETKQAQQKAVVEGSSSHNKQGPMSSGNGSDGNSTTVLN